MMDVLKFIGLVIKQRQVRIANPAKAEELDKKIEKACNEYLQSGFIESKDIK